MIQHIKIENYKSIPSLELDLGRVNVLVGENGCGKTNVLEAVALGAAAAVGRLGNEFLATRGVRMTNDQAMKSGFDKNSQARACSYSFSDEHSGSILVEIPNFREKDIETEFLYVTIHSGDLPQTPEKKLPNTDEANYDKLFVADAARKVARKIHLDNFLLFCPENTHLRRFDDEGQIRPLGIRGEGLFSHLADLTRKDPAVFQKINETLQLIDWFEGFEIPNDLIFNERRIRIRDRYLEEGIAYIDQRSSNEGFLYLLFYVTLFVSPYTPKFFAIDNIDNALNPRLCAKLIEVLVRLAKENDKQVLLTAHNPGLLDGLNLTDPEQRLFVISRNKVGHTKALRIEQKPSANGHEPVRLSEQFLRGYIGGLPNI